MIRRLLIANRGEIACRIARTAHRIGIATVGVYSEPDAGALHVDAVDVAVALGGATPAESYLRGDAVIQAALDTGCDAVHPGYGFLAESAAFARAVSAAGPIWVGPTPEQIELLGDKLAAKKAAMAAGVPTAAAVDAAPGALPGQIPLPALVKAAAGGGGRGMRVVREIGELAAAVEAASREAEAAFGDGRVFIEPYLERGRHVEVQIIGDAHGNVIHLGERECSIQRRNQKIVEETPSPGIDDATRSALWDGALALARHVGYRSAGTVEFLVGPDGTVDFLEVNTRLQVEHPVTEAVTGLDLVELQLRVAAGEPLPLAQEDVRFDGHAIEVRLVAEDPAAGWLPSAGAITAFAIGDAVRIDSGVRAGSVVSTDYDSLLAKVISHGPSRGEAARRLARSLRGAHLGGPATNRDALVAILEEPDFLAGTTPITYLAEHPDVVAAIGPEGDERVALLLAAVVNAARHDRRADPWAFAPPGWRNLPTQGLRSTWRDDRGVVHHAEEVWRDDATAEILVGPWPVPGDDGHLGRDERRRVAVRVLPAAGDGLALELDGRRRVVAVTRSAAGVTTTAPAGGATWVREPRFVTHGADEAGRGPVCPLPGRVIAVHVAESQEVEEGDVLMVIEAMKMEHTITAGSPATVAAVRFAIGDRVDAGDLLVELRRRD